MTSLAVPPTPLFSLRTNARAARVLLCRLLLFCAATAIAASAQSFTSLYSFPCTQSGCPDGNRPTGALVQGVDGNFCGTTVAGGTTNVGTAFKITPSGTLTSLHSFDKTDGLYPFAGLLLASDGNFYGTTATGGNLTLAMSSR
jgi:uncharacterized repeat protein (TIGR03803 family)